MREITGLTLTSATRLRSTAAQTMIENGILSNQLGEEFLLEIEFDSRRRKQTVDFRPQLPLIFQL